MSEVLGNPVDPGKAGGRTYRMCMGSGRDRQASKSTRPQLPLAAAAADLRQGVLFLPVATTTGSAVVAVVAGDAVDGVGRPAATEVSELPDIDLGRQRCSVRATITFAVAAASGGGVGMGRGSGTGKCRRIGRDRGRIATAVEGTLLERYQANFLLQRLHL